MPDTYSEVEWDDNGLPIPFSLEKNSRIADDLIRDHPRALIAHDTRVQAAVSMHGSWQKIPRAEQDRLAWDNPTPRIRKLMDEICNQAGVDSWEEAMIHVPVLADLQRRVADSIAQTNRLMFAAAVRDARALRLDNEVLPSLLRGACRAAVTAGTPDAFRRLTLTCTGDEYAERIMASELQNTLINMGGTEPYAPMAAYVAAHADELPEDIRTAWGVHLHMCSNRKNPTARTPSFDPDDLE